MRSIFSRTALLWFSSVDSAPPQVVAPTTTMSQVSRSATFSNSKQTGRLTPLSEKGEPSEPAPADTESTDDTRAYRVSAAQDGNIVVAINRPSGLQIRSLDTRGKTLAEGSFKFPNTHKRATPGPLLGLTKDTALLIHFNPNPVESFPLHGAAPRQPHHRQTDAKHGPRHCHWRTKEDHGA